MPKKPYELHGTVVDRHMTIEQLEDMLLQYEAERDFAERQVTNIELRLWTLRQEEQEGHDG